MNGRERILTALSLKEADRVPLYIHAINEKPIILLTRDSLEGLPDPEITFYDMNDHQKLLMLEALFLVHEQHDIDGMTALEFGHEERISDDEVRDAWGVVYQLNPYGLPVAKYHPVQEKQDLKAFTPPKPSQDYLLLLMAARQRFADTKALFWMMRGTFVLSWRLAGMENLMLKMFDDPAFVHGIAEMTYEYNVQMLDMLVEAGLDVLIIEDDIADKNFPLIAPDQFLEFINPYNRRLVALAHEKGLKVIRHSDGNLWPLLEILLDTGYDGLNPLEPQAGMDLKKLKDYCGDRLCFLGNIDCIDLLPNGTPEQVEATVKKAIADAGQGGGLVIASSNSLHPGVKPENCVAMFDAAKKHGQYPLKLT